MKKDQIIAISSTGTKAIKVYTYNTDSSSITVIDGSSGTVLHSIPVNNTDGMAFSKDKSLLYAVDVTGYKHRNR